MGHGKGSLLAGSLEILEIQGLLNISLQQQIKASDEPHIVRGRECSKKHALSLSEGSIQQGRSPFDVRSVLIVREHGKRATCLREAAPAGKERSGLSAVALAKAGGFFQHSHIGFLNSHAL